jgi:hypothetical protein
VRRSSSFSIKPLSLSMFELRSIIAFSIVVNFFSVIHYWVMYANIIESLKSISMRVSRPYFIKDFRVENPFELRRILEIC